MSITIESGITIEGGIIAGPAPVTIGGGVTHSVTSNGNAQISSSLVKFGTGSYTSNSLRGYIEVTPYSDFAWGTGNFTIEFWYYPTSTSVVSTLIDLRPVATDGAYSCIYINSNRTVNWYVNALNKITSAVDVLTTNTWNSIAIVRSSGSTKMYVNGTQTGSTYADTNNYLAGACVIGADAGVKTGAYYAMGNMDEIRFSNVARYYGNYTPATAAFWTDSNTKLLLHCDGTSGSTSFIDSSNWL